MALKNNLAYDISVYEPVEKRESQRKIVAQKTAKEKSISAFKALVTALATVLLLCAILYGKVKTTELYNKEAQLEAQLSELTSDNNAMRTQLESKVSLNNVEEYAVNVLGLQKLEQGQIEYLEVESDNITKVIVEKDKSVFGVAKNWFDEVLEYIGI